MAPPSIPQKGSQHASDAGHLHANMTWSHNASATSNPSNLDHLAQRLGVPNPASHTAAPIGVSDHHGNPSLSDFKAVCRTMFEDGSNACKADWACVLRYFTQHGQSACVEAFHSDPEFVHELMAKLPSHMRSSTPKAAYETFQHVLHRALIVAPSQRTHHDPQHNSNNLHRRDWLDDLEEKRAGTRELVIFGFAAAAILGLILMCCLGECVYKVSNDAMQSRARRRVRRAALAQNQGEAGAHVSISRPAAAHVSTARLSNTRHDSTHAKYSGGESDWIPLAILNAQQTREDDHDAHHQHHAHNDSTGHSTGHSTSHHAVHYTSHSTYNSGSYGDAGGGGGGGGGGD